MSATATRPVTLADVEHAQTRVRAEIKSTKARLAAEQNATARAFLAGAESGAPSPQRARLEWLGDIAAGLDAFEVLARAAELQQFVEVDGPAELARLKAEAETNPADRASAFGRYELCRAGIKAAEGDLFRIRTQHGDVFAEVAS